MTTVLPPIAGRWLPPTADCHLESPAWAQAVLEHILAKCTECGDCMRWTGYVHPGDRRPMITMAQKHGINARRVVWECHRGQPMRRGYFPRLKCGDTLCLNPEHIVAKTRSEMMREPQVVARINEPVLAARRIKARQARAKLGPDDLALIKARKAAGENRRVIAADFGIHPTMVNKVCRGEVRGLQALIPQASIFTMAEAA